MKQPLAGWNRHLAVVPGHPAISLEDIANIYTGRRQQHTPPLSLKSQLTSFVHAQAVTLLLLLRWPLVGTDVEEVLSKSKNGGKTQHYASLFDT